MNPAESMDRVLVMGAGTMGHAIAQVFASAGLTVYLVDPDQAALDRALDLIQGNLAFLAHNTKLDPARTPAVLDRIEPHLEPPAAAHDVNFAVEAVVEDPEVKSAVFQKLEGLLPAEAVIATNTSSLDVFAESGMQRPERLVAAHWFVPAYIIPLVEVAGGESTSTRALDLTVDLLKRVGKEPVRMKRFVPGFIVNRLQFALTEAVLELLDQGWAEAGEIDRAVKSCLGIRLPLVGAVQTLDFTGLDLADRVMRARGLTSPTLTRCLSRGRRGVKDGAGLYDYGGRTEAQVIRDRDGKYLAIKAWLEENGFFEPL
jgi:3-hydroxybutyryl-CoA dehydrogenase